MATSNVNNTSSNESNASVIAGPGIFGFFRDDLPQYPKDLHPYPESYYIYLPKDKLHPVSEWQDEPTEQKPGEAMVLSEDTAMVEDEAPEDPEVEEEQEEAAEADSSDMEVENNG